MQLCPPERPPLAVTIRVAGSQDEDSALVSLLDRCFPGTFDGRTFLKQQPHLRLLAFAHGELLGHVGLDFRVVIIDKRPFEIIGMIDLCVAPRSRGRKVGSALLRAAEKYSEGRDFAVLMADDPRLYLASGYSRIDPAWTRWLAIENLETHSVVYRNLSSCFMAKPLGAKDWPSGQIDLLGYLF